ncbi:MAG: DUF4390 domain-containing protein [Acidobacteriota bacterium]
MGARVGQALGLAFTLLVSWAPAWGAEIVDLVPLIKKDKLVLSLHMTQAFVADIERAIASGLPVQFRYIVQLKKVRAAWFNKKVATRRVMTTVTYDNLTKRYKLFREVDGEIDATAVVSDPEEMRRFMTTLESMELFDTSLLEPNGEYYLRVKGVMKDRNLFLFIPWDLGSAWKKAYFTYLP